MDYLLYWGLSLAFVLALILGLALLGKKLLLPQATNRKIFGKANKRLELIEICQIDQKSRLLLIRRDDTEHLILQGGANETVIERDIKPGNTSLEKMSPSSENPSHEHKGPAQDDA